MQKWEEICTGDTTSYHCYNIICGPGSSVGIATDYGLDGPGIESRWDDIFRQSRPALEPTQPPVQWVTGSFPGVKCGRSVLLTPHPLLVPPSWKRRAIPLPSLWATTGPLTYIYTIQVHISYSRVYVSLAVYSSEVFSINKHLLTYLLTYSMEQSPS